MKNACLIEMFLNGAEPINDKGRYFKGSNLAISGDELINYSTCICCRLNGKIVLNNQSYSKTTRVHQII